MAVMPAAGAVRPTVVGAAFCARLSAGVAAAILRKPVRSSLVTPHSCIWATADLDDPSSRQIVAQIYSTDQATIKHLGDAIERSGHATPVSGVGRRAFWAPSFDGASHSLQVFTGERAFAISLSGGALANDREAAEKAGRALVRGDR